MDFNIDDLTLGECEQLEEIAGTTVDKLFTGSGMSAKVLTAVALVLLRRTNPDATLEDARAVKLTDIQDDATTDPSAAAGN